MSNVNVFEIDPDLVDPVESRKAVLAMQATGFHVLGDGRFEQANDRLICLAQKIGKPATMTYEDVIFLNNTTGEAPVRVISESHDVAEQEAEFYQKHRVIENRLFTAVDILMQNYVYHSHMTYRGRAELTAQMMIEEATDIVRSLYQSLSKEQFVQFRPFFVGLNGYPGPSGLYSASLPILDLLVHGGINIDFEEREKMHDNLEQGLYPSFKNGTLLLETLLNADKPQLDIFPKEKDTLLKRMRAFRQTHRESVKKLVPEAMDGTADGSGGMKNVAEYLDSKIVKDDEGENND